VERQALSGTAADARKAGQLRDEVLDGRREHAAILPGLIGLAAWPGINDFS
jgi:hypothetical protein